MLSVVMYPLWPYTLRLGVYYLSMGVLCLLGLFFGMAILRLIFYVITLVVAKPGIWVFPRLFEDVSFVSHSFLTQSCRAHSGADLTVGYSSSADGLVDASVRLGRASEEEGLIQGQGEGGQGEEGQVGQEGQQGSSSSRGDGAGRSRAHAGDGDSAQVRRRDGRGDQG